MNTPDINIVTGIRRSGKSKHLSAFARYVRSIDPTANAIEIDLTKLRFEKLKEYHALNEYVEEQYARTRKEKIAYEWIRIVDIPR